jgi:hypothetical protein
MITAHCIYSDMQSIHQLIFFSLYEFFSIIIAATLANPVGQFRFFAIGTNRQTFNGQGIMGSSFMGPLMGVSSLGKRHFLPLYLIK